MRAPFRIYNVLGDAALQFVQSTPTLEEARGRVSELGKHWAGEYVIENQETGERVLINTRGEP